MKNDPSLAALGRALDFFGNHGAMARALGITPRELLGARQRGRVNGKIAEKIHQLTAGTVRREELRPDLYPRRRHYERVRLKRLNERRQRHD